ncbi:MAG TPA: GPP34 family phosphoprotein [Propionibacteriaceae bacterium]|nr:GPP34 family phosphoprotein [Propionibacteriaceae bacterium]HPZ48318.1 GPP34 family phosphoprotein [Propionibacteriaceae bacterium]HQE30811.1 GPP34 family phosphoprotein [Propionibacteriaceae bacterium]
MLLCEDLLLLLTDDASGKNIAWSSELAPLLGGAMLCDLVLGGHVRLTEKGEDRLRRNRVVIDTDMLPTSDRLLAESYERLAGKRSWSTQAAVRKLQGKLKERLYERLVTAELLSADRETVLGVIPVTRYRPVDPSYERTLTDTLDRTLIGGETPDDHTAALIGLLHAGGHLVKVTDRGRGIDRRAAKARAKELMKQFWPAKAAYDVIQANRAAAAG